MLRYGLPLSVSTIASGFLLQFYNFMMAIYCSDLVIGNYQAAVNFSVLITFFTTPIATVLFPAFSKINPKREIKTLQTVFQSSIKYASLLTIPVTAAVMVLSKPLVYTLFGEKYADTPLLLTLYAIIYIYTGLGSLSLRNLLNGQGKTKTTMHLTLLDLSIGLPLSLILIPRFQIFGLIATILIARIPSLTIGLRWIKRQYATTVEWTASTRIYLASGLAATVTYLLLSPINSYHWIELIIGGIIFLITYITAVPLIRAIKKDDIENLKWILSELGPITKLLNLPLIMIEKLLTIFHEKVSKRSKE